MFNTANGLNKGFHLLVSNFSQDGYYIPPSVLCSIFCLELLLKCLQVINEDTAYTKDDLKKKGIIIDAHKYTDIFDKIDNTLKHKVVEQYNRMYNSDISENNYRNMLIDVGDNNFIEWRYVYEKNEDKVLNIPLQTKLIDSLGETISIILRQKEHE